jgi:NADH dehydrogenase
VKAVTIRPKVVIIGAGFGGLRAARALRRAPVDVLLLDRKNYHAFWPLLYEVASAGLEPDDIAQPVRAILRGAPNIRFRMAEVLGVDIAARRIRTDSGDVPYDYLIVSAGSVTNYFGLDSVEQRALALKDLREATDVRNSVLRAFERANMTPDPDERERLMTVVIAGGGPTGVELAGALAELKRHVLPRDYPDLDLSRARVVLVEATDALLPSLPKRLQRKALEQLRSLGVEVRLGEPVSAISDGGVVLRNGETIAAENVVWVAGVRAAPLADTIGMQLGPGGRVRVLPTMQIPGDESVFAIGDIAYLEDPHGAAYPMVAPVAMQQADVAAANVVRLLRGEPLRTFRYRDRGTMATIGRRKAVAHVFGLQFSGLIAWVLWLTVHLVQLVGFRNRALVLVNWIWNYFRYDRANRLVTDTTGRRGRAPDDRSATSDAAPAAERDDLNARDEVSAVERRS